MVKFKRLIQKLYILYKISSLTIILVFHFDIPKDTWGNSPREFRFERFFGKIGTRVF